MPLGTLTTCLDVKPEAFTTDAAAGPVRVLLGAPRPRATSWAASGAKVQAALQACHLHDAGSCWQDGGSSARRTVPACGSTADPNGLRPAGRHGSSRVACFLGEGTPGAGGMMPQQQQQQPQPGQFQQPAPLPQPGMQPQGQMPQQQMQPAPGAPQPMQGQPGQQPMQQQQYPQPQGQPGMQNNQGGYNNGSSSNAGGNDNGNDQGGSGGGKDGSKNGSKAKQGRGGSSAALIAGVGTPLGLAITGAAIYFLFCRRAPATDIGGDSASDLGDSDEDDCES
mmetsp:Transcript_80222/g.259800  ORF Transcript_80222/g.259800 Transcript_80222/m.259800 type:complete len:280 (-) Transcript_80222:128-967(-)